MTREEAVIILDGFKNNPLFNDTHVQALDMAISALSEELSEDGTLTVHVSDGSKVSRVFVKGDNIFGGLYYPDSAEIKEIKEPTLLESFKDSTGKVSEIWAVKGKLQIRTRGIIHNCNGVFGNDISVKSVNGAISVFHDSAENKGEPKTGHWIEHVEHCESIGAIPSGLGAYKWCSNCDCGIDVREWHRNDYNFCPKCGADMRGEANE